MAKGVVAYSISGATAGTKLREMIRALEIDVVNLNGKGEKVLDVFKLRDEVGAELLGETCLGDGHADRVSKPLAKGAGGGLDAGGKMILGMPGGLRAELTEVLDLVDGHVLVSEEVQRGVEQH